MRICRCVDFRHGTGWVWSGMHLTTYAMLTFSNLSGFINESYARARARTLTVFLLSVSFTS